MAFWDVLIIITYFIFSFTIAVYFFNKAGKDTIEFFLSGRNLPWYLAGLSMVATTFAADTPLAVTELVAKNGIAGNWLWWNFAFGGMLTVFFFSRLWRRAGIVTEVEFAELRYSGKPAKFLRGFRAVYLGLLMNIVIIGWVNRAMASILTGFFGIDGAEVYYYIFACMLLVAVYSALSGLWGVVITDAFQFIIAMTGCIILSVIVLNSPQIGGMENLKNELPTTIFSFYPQISEPGEIVNGFALSIFSFLAYIGFIWWASWYPGNEPGGGGYVVQRMLSAKNEKHSMFATLFFQVAHYAIRPWPWIIVALCALVLYPQLPNNEKGMGYIYAMKDFLPVGLKGLLVAAFFAAYMSTVATQLNWGTSYLINDFYRRFITKNKSERHYIFTSRIATLLLMVAAVIVTLFIQEIHKAWEFILECGAGVGLVLILRWFWWRINAWSEISAMIAPFIIYPVLKIYNIDFPFTVLIIVPITTFAWLVVTFLTKPVNEKTLFAFYSKIHPGGVLWKKISDKLPGVKSDGNFTGMFVNWSSGVLLVYSLLFSTGSLLFGDYFEFFMYLLIGIISVFIIYKNISRINWE